jgi:parallel beta-helix repeat protein
VTPAPGTSPVGDAPASGRHRRRARLLLVIAAVVVVLVAGGVASGRILSWTGLRGEPPPADPGSRPVAGQPRMAQPAAQAGVPATARGCRGTPVRPGAAVQALLDAAGPGATLCFQPGIHRLAEPLRPLARQRLVGAPGAVLSGARPVGGWTRAGGAWTARGGLPREPDQAGECETGTACRYAETVFLDGRPLQRVTSRSDLAPGRFHQDYGADRITLADDPGGRRVEVALARAALAGSATGVTVEGFVIEAFANPAQSGAVEPEGAGWTIRRNEVRFNHGVGIFTRDGGRVLANRIHRNGQLGVGGQGPGGLVQGNEIDHNNTAGFDSGWEAGASKWVETTGLVIRGNDVHDNRGAGLWTDINNVGTTIEGNVVHGNSDFGIHHEISYRAVIRGNEVTGNGWADRTVGYGGAGIRVAASPDVQVSGNVLSGNQNAIILLQQDRTGDQARAGPHELADVLVAGNDVALSTGAVGLMQDIGDRSYFSRRNIRFERNTYRLARLDGRWFAWENRLVDRSGWMRHRHDTSGRYLPIRAPAP